MPGITLAGIPFREEDARSLLTDVRVHSDTALAVRTYLDRG